MAKLYWTDDKIRETVRYTLEVEQGLKIEEIPSVVSKLYLINVGLRKQLGRFKDSPVNLLKFVYPNTFSEEQFKTRRNSPAIYAKNKKDNTSNKNDDIWDSIKRVINSKDVKNKDLILSIIQKCIDLKVEDNKDLLTNINNLLSNKNILDKNFSIENKTIKKIEVKKETKQELNTNKNIVCTNNEIIIKTENKTFKPNINNKNLFGAIKKEEIKKETIDKKEIKQKVRTTLSNKSIDELIEYVNNDKFKKIDILKHIEIEDRKFYKLSDFEWYDRVENNYKEDFIWIKARKGLVVEKVKIKKINEFAHKVQMIINSDYILKNGKIIISLNLKYNEKEKVWISSYRSVKFIDTSKDDTYENLELKNKLSSLCPPLSIHGDFEKVIINALESLKTYKDNKIIQIRQYIFN